MSGPGDREPAVDTAPEELILVSATDARARWYELVRLAESGQTVVITRRGKPVVRLDRRATAPATTEPASGQRTS